jgi:hypothetical protein
MGAAMTLAAKAFKQVMGAEGTEGVGYPIDREARLEAGFTENEVQMAMEAVTPSLAGKPSAAPAARSTG